MAEKCPVSNNKYLFPNVQLPLFKIWIPYQDIIQVVGDSVLQQKPIESRKQEISVNFTDEKCEYYILKFKFYSLKCKLYRLKCECYRQECEFYILVNMCMIFTD